MKKILVILMLLVAGTAQAQANSCDKPVLTGTINISTPTFQFSIGIPSGQPIPDGFTYKDNGVKTDLPAVPSGTAINGQTCFDVSVTVVGNGNHTITTSWFTLNGSNQRQEAADSGPFVLSLGKPTPTVSSINHQR